MFLRYRDVDRLTLFCLKEGVGESEASHSCHGRIVIELRVNVKENWHVHLFVWIKNLLLETEALNLVKVLASIEGDYIIRRYASHWLVCWVSSCVEGQSSFSRHHCNLFLLWFEMPPHSSTRVRIEPYNNRSLSDWFHFFHLLSGLDLCHRASVARCLTEQPVQWDCSVRQTQNHYCSSYDVAHSRSVWGATTRKVATLHERETG